MVDRQRSDPDIRMEAERDLLLQQLITNMSELTSEVREIGRSITEVKLQLVDGSGRMNQLEERIGHNKVELEGRIDSVRRVISGRVDGLEERLEEHNDDERAQRGRWSGLVPTIIGGIVTSLTTAAVIGGILAYTMN